MTDFERKVYDAVKKIPKGKVTTYKQVAKNIGSPKAVRAVGNALNKNPFAPQVPCHRVIKTNLSVGKYAKGEEKKKALLREEGLKIKNNKVSSKFLLSD